MTATTPAPVRLCSRSDLPTGDCYHCRGLEDVVVPELGLAVEVREQQLPRLAMMFDRHIAFTATGCDGCGRTIRRGEAFHRSSDGTHWCWVCL